MATEERAEQIGGLIRQLRRQRNITQMKLGATRYSKSYVSGVEKNTMSKTPLYRLGSLCPTLPKSSTDDGANMLHRSRKGLPFGLFHSPDDIFPHG
jgi:hypothetical protein